MEAVAARRQLISSRPDVKILFPFRHQISHPLFLCERRRKEKAIKKKCRKGDAKRGLFEKSPLLNSPKNFLAAGAGMLGVCTQSSVSADQPRRKAVFEKSPLLNSPKNFLAAGAGMLGECTQSNVPAYSPRRKAAAVHSSPHFPA